MSTKIAKAEPSQPAHPSRSEVSKEIAISIVKSSIGVIPWIGQALNEALFDCRGRIKQERLNKFFSEVADEVGRLGEEKIDKEYLSTEEFSDYLEQIVKRAAETRSDKKRSSYRKLLVSGLQGKKPPDLSGVFLDILEEISDPEMNLFTKFFQMHLEFKKFSEAEAEATPDHQYWYFTPDKITSLEIEQTDFRTMVQSMIRKGLLFDESGGRWGRRPYDIIRISEIGVRFYAYLTST